MKMTKSWIMTIASFIFALAAPPLADAGILISEEQITHYMMMFFGISGIGAGMSVKKKVAEVKAKKVTIPPPPLDPVSLGSTTFTMDTPEGGQAVYNGDGKKLLEVDKEGTILKEIPDLEMPQKPLQTDQATNPKYTNEGWFQTDLEFVKGTGAVMRRDDPFLWIKVPDAVYIKGGVYQGTDLKDPETRLIQIDSNTGDSLRFEMYDKAAGNLVPLPPGKYMFRFAATYDMKGLPKAGDGVFTIV